MGWETNDDGLEVVTLVDRAGTKLVVVKSAHSPAQGSILLSQLGVVLLTSAGKQKAVCLTGVLILVDMCRCGPFFRGGVDVNSGHLLGVTIEHRGFGLCGRALDIAAVLDDCVVGNLSELRIRGSLLRHKRRSLNHIPNVKSVILLDDLAVDEGDEEQGREDEESKANSKSDGSDVPCGLVGQTESGRSLVDNGECANGTGDEEEEGRCPDGPSNGVLANVHDVLDQREDDRSKNSGRNRSHAEASEDGSQARTRVPSPLYVASTNSSNTDTCDGGDQGVSRRDVC